MAADNEPAEAALRANTLRTTAPDLAALLPVPSHPAPGVPEGLVLEAPYDAHGAAEWREGLFMPQSRAAMAVARVLAPGAGERVLDLCAAPGGKTTHLAALMEDRGEVVAVEQHRGRAAALERTARRMGASCVTVRVADAAEPQEAGAYDRVLVDPPCSDLGTLASRPDARWRKTADQPERLARTQAAILRAGAAALAPGGTLVYSTCTISPTENERVIAAFLAEHPAFAADDLRRDAPVWQHSSVPSPPADAAAPRRHGGILHRSPAQRRGPVSTPEVDLGPVCPACHEPWLRPTNLPGRYRCVNCLTRFELSSVCPDCGEHSTIVRMSDTALYACNNCGSSMLQPM